MVLLVGRRQLPGRRGPGSRVFQGLPLRTALQNLSFPNNIRAKEWSFQGPKRSHRSSTEQSFLSSVRIFQKETVSSRLPLPFLPPLPADCYWSLQPTCLHGDTYVTALGAGRPRARRRHIWGPVGAFSWPAGGRRLPVSPRGSGRALASSLCPFSSGHQSHHDSSSRLATTMLGTRISSVCFGGTQTGSPQQPPNSKHTLKTLCRASGKSGRVSPPFTSPHPASRRGSTAVQTEHVAFPRPGLGSHAGSPPRPAAVNFSLAGCSEDTRRQREQPCWAGVPAPWRSVEAEP